MNLEIPIDKKELAKLGEALPQGGVNELVKRTNKSQAYISQFFAGRYNVTDENKIIIEEAQKVIQEQKEKAEILSKQIKQSVK